MPDYPVGRGVTGEDGKGTIRDSHVHERDGHQGLVVYTRDDIIFNPRPRFFTNDVNGIDLNKDGSFGGVPAIIHDGLSDTGAWVGSALQGTWDFSTSNVITQAAANDGDEATFAQDDTGSTDVTAFTALSGDINLTTYTEANHDIEFTWDLAGATVGDPVSLEDFINPGSLGTSQAFTIPLTNFNFPSDDIDGLSVLVSRLGGSKPNFTLDNITLQQSGSIEYRINKDRAVDYHITAVRFSFADLETGTVTDGTMPGLSFDKILEQTALTNGITFRRVQDGETTFSATLRQLSDFLRIGSLITNRIDDGTNVFITLEVPFTVPIILSGTPEQNYLSITIADNLSTFLLFNVAVRGAEPQ